MTYLDDKRERMPSIIAAAAVLAIALALCAVLCAVQASRAADVMAVQQANGSGLMMASSSGSDTSPLYVGAPQTEVPDLHALVGLTYDQAVAAIGHGATQLDARSGDYPFPVRGSLATFALTTERSDPLAGAPTVYLDLDDTGRVAGAGYSVSMESLGYNADLSLRQAVRLLHVPERTLTQCGVPVDDGLAQLPDNRMAYSTYRDDGTTLEREFATFQGSTAIEGIPATWHAAMEYNYEQAVKSGNLADTVHLVTVGVSWE